MPNDERIKAALSIAELSAGDGDHHKTWIVDQMVRVLTGSEYEAWIESFCQGEDGPNTYRWDVGIAP